MDIKLVRGGKYRGSGIDVIEIGEFRLQDTIDYLKCDHLHGKCALFSFNKYIGIHC